MAPLRAPRRARRAGSTSPRVEARWLQAAGPRSAVSPRLRVGIRVGRGCLMVVVNRRTRALRRPAPWRRPAVIAVSACQAMCRRQVMLGRPPVHRPIIEPFIIQLSQSPFMCWRIQVTMSSHHVDDGALAVFALTQERQLVSIRSGSPHIIDPIIRPSVTCWFIQAVMSPHQLALPAAAVGVLIIQFVHVWFTLATWTAVDGWAGEVSSRPAAIANPTPRPAARRTTATTGSTQRRRVAGVATSFGRVSVMPPGCTGPTTGDRAKGPNSDVIGREQ